jgi:flavin-binding protein dodecin
MKKPATKNQVYKLIELTGTSPDSVENAVERAIRRASRTIKHLSWFEVVEIRGSIDAGRVHRWQVTLKVGFLIED